MEGVAGSGFSVASNGIRKKRSDASRRPRHDSQTLLQNNVVLPASVELFSNGKNENNGDKVVVFDGPRSENKLKKLKLKVGGVTRTIHNKFAADFASGSGSSIRKSYSSADITTQESQLRGDTTGSTSSNASDRRKGFGVRLNSVSKIDFTSQTEHSSRGIPVNCDNIRKSNRVPKRRVLDTGFDEDDDIDEEIRYLERLNASKNLAGVEDEKDYGSKRDRMIFKVPKCRVVMDVLYNDAAGNSGSPRLGKDLRKRSRSDKECEDGDYVEEKEQISDEGHISSGKKVKRGSPSVYIEGWSESTHTTRTRAMQSVLGPVDFSNQLPASNSRRKKEKLSELEQQLKKAEAAQRRRMQSEKAAREAEAEAIRKILGQDSGRKKREEKMKKQRDELLQEKAANALALASNTIRWVNSPTGTIVTFSEDIGLPTIFNSVPCSYPPAREKCAGPNCRNAYKYRDSKSNLPLCSLQCYKAVQQNVQSIVTY